MCNGKEVNKNMEKGYIEMADINLQISRDFFELERECQKYYDSSFKKQEEK